MPGVSLCKYSQLQRKNALQAVDVIIKNCKSKFLKATFLSLFRIYKHYYFC